MAGTTNGRAPRAASSAITARAISAMRGDTAAADPDGHGHAGPDPAVELPHLPRDGRGDRLLDRRAERLPDPPAAGEREVQLPLHDIERYIVEHHALSGRFFTTCASSASPCGPRGEETGSASGEA